MSGWRRLPWDSEFFGVEVARVEAPLGDGVVAAAAAAGMRCLYLLADAGDGATTRAAEDAGFHLVDIRVTFTRPVEPVVPGLAARDAVVGDLPALIAMSAGMFGDSRFYADPGFARERCDALYAAWITGSVERRLAERTLVIELDGAIAGFISWRGEDGAGSIGLVGVGEAWRGRGVGQALVAHAIALSAAAGHGRITVVTQGRNRASQRLYQRAGFVTDAVALWYHAWPYSAGTP
jgi:GNAT superfamily N-acetyltransferase